MARSANARPPRPRAAIRKMAPYRPPSSGRGGKLRLDFNENTLGCSPRVVRLLRKIATRGSLAVYPEYQETIPKLASFFGVNPDEVLLSNGTDEAIHAIISTFVEPGEEVLVPWPTFPMFKFYAERAGTEVKTVPYRPPDLSFPLKELLRAINRNTRAILIASPNNPTGVAIGLDAVETILRRARGKAVLIDEAYFDFYGITAIPLISRYPNLFVSRTLSKVYGLAALRVGILFSQAENVAAMRKGQSPYSVTSLGAACAVEALADQEYVQAYVAEALASRKMICGALDQWGVPYYPSQANFVLARFGERAREVYEQLRDQGILVRDRSHEVPGTVRITAGTRSQTRKLLRELKRILS